MTYPLTKEDGKFLLLIEDKRDKLFFAIGLYAGRRVQEITHMKWGWLLNDRGPRIWVPKQKKWMYFPRSRKLTKIINECYEGQDLDSYFMIGRAGCDGSKPMSTTGVNSIIKKYFAEKGIKTIKETSHCLRKTFAVRFIEANRDKEKEVDLLIWLQKYFGHKDLDTTIRYIGFEAKRLGELCENIDYSI